MQSQIFSITSSAHREFTKACKLVMSRFEKSGKQSIKKKTAASLQNRAEISKTSIQLQKIAYYY